MTIFSLQIVVCLSNSQTNQNLLLSKEVDIRSVINAMFWKFTQKYQLSRARGLFTILNQGNRKHVDDAVFGRDLYALLRRPSKLNDVDWPWIKRLSTGMSEVRGSEMPVTFVVGCRLLFPGLLLHLIWKEFVWFYGTPTSRIMVTAAPCNGFWWLMVCLFTMFMLQVCHKTFLTLLFTEYIREPVSFVLLIRW